MAEMHTDRTVMIRSVCVSLIALSGCGAEGGDGGTDAVFVDGTETAPVPTTVAAIEWPTGQRVVFLETSLDEIVVHETGDVGTRPMTLDRHAVNLVDLYAQLVDVPDPAVVAALERADLRAEQEAEASSAGVLTPTPEPPQIGEVAKTADALSEVGTIEPMTPQEFESIMCDFEENGFEGGFCRLSFAGPADTGWVDDLSFIRSIVVPIKGDAVTHNERKFVCTSSIPIVNICLTAEWRTTATQTIARGKFGIFTSTNKWTRYTAGYQGWSSGLFHLGAVWDFL